MTLPRSLVGPRLSQQQRDNYSDTTQKSATLATTVSREVTCFTNIFIMVENVGFSEWYV